MTRLTHDNAYKTTIITALLAIVLLFGSCSKSSDEPDPSERRAYSSLLLYAVASNNLASALHDDINEMLNACEYIDMDRNDIYVYYLTKTKMPALYAVRKKSSGDDYELVSVKDYDRSVYSTDPTRISEVIADYNSIASPSDSKGIIFWSHGTGWSPDFSDHKVPGSGSKALDYLPPATNHSYGYDDFKGHVDKCDIIELADAIPDGYFNFIWFDCCYMGGIETLYQLRDKAEYIVAYPTEVWSEGMPYDLTIPSIVRKNPDLIGAAARFADYFISKKRAVTIGVFEMKQIEAVAEVAMQRADKDPAPKHLLQCYSRSPIGPFYDFGQMTKSAILDFKGSWSREAFDKAMSEFEDSELDEVLDKFTVYKAAYTKDFDNNDLKLKYYSGISAHYHYYDYTEESNYYLKLDWYKRTHPNGPTQEDWESLL